MARTKLKLKSIASGTIPGRIKIASENITAGSVDSDAMGAGAISPAKLSTTSQSLTNRNIFQNGAMNISQRSTSETGIGSGAVDTYKTLDRVGIAHGNTDGRLTMTQTADGPSGFANCLKLDCTTADTSIAAGEYLQLKFKFEGQDLQRIKKGTSDADPLTVSFYVKGNGNATYMCELEDHDNGRNNQQQFAVTSSWNRVSLTFVADTTGAFDDDNALSLSIIFWLHAGSTYTGGTYTANTWTGSVSAANRAAGISSFFSSTSNTFFLTGMQVEVGDTATEFEHEIFGRTYEKCERYYQKSYIHSEKPGGSTYGGTGTYLGSTYVQSIYNTTYNQQLYYMQPFRTKMRAAPTINSYNVYLGTEDGLMHYASGTNHGGAFTYQSENSFRFYGSSLSSTGNNNGGDGYAYHWVADAEL